MTMPALTPELELAIQKSIWQGEQEEAQKQAAKVAQGVYLRDQQAQIGPEYDSTLKDIEARQKVLDTQLGQIDAAYRDENGLINEKQALLDLQRSQIDPAFQDQQKVFAAQQALNMAQSDQYRLQVSQLSQKRQELQALTAAQDNIKNQLDVAAGKRQRASFDTRYAAAGVSPQEIQAPLNGEVPSNLPPGVRLAIETDAERVARQNERSEAYRGLDLEGAQLNTTNAQLGVNQAALGRNMGDADRQRAVDFAQIGVGGASLAADRGALTRGVDLNRVKLAEANTNVATARSDAERKRQLEQSRINSGLAGLGLS